MHFTHIAIGLSMKNAFIAGLVLTLISGAAAAQTTTTLYGVLDVGLTTRNHAPAGTPKNSLDNGGSSPSIWGVRGTEDLGGGLQASFNLEGQFKVDDGTQLGQFFRRKANIGISDAHFGTVRIGVQHGPAILAFAATDPRGARENYSGLYTWAFGSGSNPNQDVGVFLRNAVTYSHTIGAVNFGAGYSLSEGQGKVVSLGATYTGPLTVSAAYEASSSAATSERVTTKGSIGAAYSVGDLTGRLNYLKAVNKDPVTRIERTDVGMVGAGVDWQTAPGNLAMAAIYVAKDKDNGADKTRTFILSDEYSLSKRTTLYGTLALVDAKAGATINTTVVAANTQANTKTTFLNVGVKHSF